MLLPHYGGEAAVVRMIGLELDRTLALALVDR